jgi:hypothetical protein
MNVAHLEAPTARLLVAAGLLEELIAGRPDRARRLPCGKPEG